MKEKIRRVFGALCLAVFAFSVLLFILTIFKGGWLFLVLGAPFLLAGFFLRRKEIMSAPAEEKPKTSNAQPRTKKSVKHDASGKYDPAVLVTLHGKKFHMNPLCPGIQNADTIRMSRSKAVDAGYKPCDKCSLDFM